jgi:Family of unknown function (DUF6062)
MAISHEYQALMDACLKEGCALCRLAHESTRRYLESWKYEMFTDTTIRTELREAQGFCHTHTWELAHMCAALPLAQAYRDIISDRMEELQRGDKAISSGKRWRYLLVSKQQRPLCPACRSRAQAEKRYAYTLRQALTNEAFYTQFCASQGLCLKHFRLASEFKAADVSEEGLALLRKAQLACLQRLDAQLTDLIRKHDYRFKDEERGAEMLSWKWAAGLVAGEE